MDDFFPKPAGGGSLPGPEPTEHLDPLLDRRVEHRPWEVQSAQWQAWTLAQAAFGDEVRVLLTGRRGFQGFRGLLTLTVPFRDLEDHRARESLFLAWAGVDPVLTRVPLIFVFEPEPVMVP